LLSTVEGYRTDLNNCIEELKHKNQVLRNMVSATMKTKRLSVRIDDATMAAIERWVAAMATEIPGITVADAVRRALAAEYVTHTEPHR
jgi:hypothetical protein